MNEEGKEYWHLCSLCCPNCGNKVTGAQSADGRTKIVCNRCMAVSVQVVMGRRHKRIDVYAPKGQIILNG